MPTGNESIIAPWENPHPPFAVSWRSLALRAGVVIVCVLLYAMIGRAGPHLSPLCRSQAYVDAGLHAAMCEQVALAVQRHQTHMAVLTPILFLSVLVILAPWKLWRYRRTFMAWCRIHL